MYDIGEANGVLYLSMEYVDGEDLASSLRRMGRFPEDRAVEIARQICAGVAAAHQRGVTHRDLKPANIMLDGTGRVRVMDFGLAVAGHVGVVLEEAPYAVRNVLLYFFVLFVLRVLFRNKTAAAIAFTLFWAILTALSSDPVWAGALVGVLFYGTAAFVISRWGLLSFAVGTFVNSLLFDVLVTLDASAWYFGNTMFLIAIVLGLAFWGFYISVAGRIWSAG